MSELSQTSFLIWHGGGSAVCFHAIECHVLSCYVQLWSGAVNYPDFFAKQTQRWWEEQIRGFNHKIPLDGVWVDMNEPDNFCTGDVCYDSQSSTSASFSFLTK